MLNHVNSLCIATLYKGLITYLPFAGLLPRPGPDGFPVLLGPFGGGVVPDLLALDCALAANDPFATVPPFDFALADWIRAAAAFDIEFLDIIFPFFKLNLLSPLGHL
jgi:hypothetical protein